MSEHQAIQVENFKQVESTGKAGVDPENMPDLRNKGTNEAIKEMLGASGGKPADLPHLPLVDGNKELGAAQGAATGGAAGAAAGGAMDGSPSLDPKSHKASGKSGDHAPDGSGNRF